MELLKAGTMAPDFRLPTTPGETVALSEFGGKNVVLVFYPADWSPVCGDQLALYNEILPLFQNRNADVLGVSVDGVWCHLAYKEHRNLRFPLVSDFEPKGDLARRYGAYNREEGVAERALFVIDGKGVIRWSYLSPMDVNPGAAGIFDALESLTRTERSRHDQPPGPAASPGL